MLPYIATAVASFLGGLVVGAFGYALLLARAKESQHGKYANEADELANSKHGKK